MNVLSIVIPAYNEERAIAQIIERPLAIRPRLQEVGVDAELHPCDEHPRHPRRGADARGGHPISGASRAVQTERAAGRCPLPADHHLDCPQLHPVRVLGLAGLGLGGLAGLIGAVILGMRLSGITDWAPGVSSPSLSPLSPPSPGSPSSPWVRRSIIWSPYSTSGPSVRGSSATPSLTVHWSATSAGWD